MRFNLNNIMNSRILYTPREEIIRRKRRRRRSSVIAVLFITIFGTAALIYILRLPYWQIKHIEITGSETLSEDDLRLTTEEELRGSRFYFIPRKAIFALDGKEFSAAIITKFPKIAQLQVKKIFPDSLSLRVREREFFGVYCNDLDTATSTPLRGETVCVYIDRNGFAYEKAPQVSGSLIVKISSDQSAVLVPGQLIQPEIMEKMRDIASLLERIAEIKVTGYILFSKIESEIRTMTADGFELWFKSEDDFEKAAFVLKRVLDEEIKEQKPRLQYVDLRLGNKVFYKVRK